VPPSALAAQPPVQNEQQNDGKECSNLLVLISELYNFQVISSILVFDVIRALLEGDLTEFKVELLLKLLRSQCFAFILPANGNLNVSLQTRDNNFDKTTHLL